MRIRSFALQLLFLLAPAASASQIIVCVPLDMSYQSGDQKLTIVQKSEEVIPGGLEGILCNESRSHCVPVHLQTNIPSVLKLSEGSVSSKMVFFQSGYDAQVNYGGCEWAIDM
jgi:hypothetical protein